MMRESPVTGYSWTQETAPNYTLYCTHTQPDTLTIYTVYTYIHLFIITQVDWDTFSQSSQWQKGPKLSLFSYIF